MKTKKDGLQKPVKDVHILFLLTRNQNVSEMDRAILYSDQTRNEIIRLEGVNFAMYV